MTFLLGGAPLSSAPLSAQQQAVAAAVASVVAVAPETAITSHTLAEHALTLASYLPEGEPFEAAFIPGTNTNMLLLGLSGQLLDVESFLVVYNSEFIPLNTNVFIEEWEKVLGIPDDIFPGPTEPSREIRRTHILVKLASLGVTTVEDFEAIPPLLGVQGVTVQSGIDAGFTPTADARFTIEVDLSAGRQIFPLFFPKPFGALENQIIQDLFEKLRPANCQLDVI